MSKDAFKRELRWLVLANHRVDAFADHPQPFFERYLWRRTNDSNINERCPPIGSDVDHSDTTARETRIDPDHPQGHRLVLVEFCLHLGADVKVRVDVLNVVRLFERINQLENFARSVGVDLNLEVRNELCF